MGSALCGPRAAIDRARRLRKMLGGGMRQAGVLAASAHFALEHHVARLAEDHANARRLAEGLQKLGLPVDPEPETNMVVFRVTDVLGFLRGAQQRGVLLLPLDGERFRAVTHLDVGAADVQEAIGRIGALLEEQPALRPAA